MVGVEIEGNFHTIAYSTSHTLEMSAQTGEISSKDHNEKSTDYEITGISWSVSTDNLVEDNLISVNCGYRSLKDLILAGLPVKIALRYFDGSLGQDSLSKSNDWYEFDTASQAIISGDAVVTDLNLNAPNKQNATFSATFTGKGEFIVESDANGDSGGESTLE